MTDRLPQMLRIDASDNRRRVLSAARSLFSERGLDVTMREVARHAGVGPATLYRRFPTKQTLIDEAFADEVTRCHAIVTEGCADPDPWRGFCTVIERLVVLNVRNQGFVDAFLSANPEAAAIAAHRAALLRMVASLAHRARQAGRLRDDFVVADFLLVLQAARGLSVAGRSDAAATRFSALAIDAFRAPATS